MLRLELDDTECVKLRQLARQAVDYLLRRGYRLDSFFAFHMCDAPIGKLENYIVTSPPFFM